MPAEPLPTWLVTGATGFLGTNLGAFLNGRARRIGVGRIPREPGALFDEWVTADLDDPASLAVFIEEHRPDVVVNAAAMATHEECEAHPELARRVNADAPEALGRAATRVGARFVHLSTDAVFDGRSGHYREEDEPAPFSVYGRTKLAGEQQVLGRPGTLVVRTNFFGWSPTGRRSILEFFVNSLSAGERVQGFTDFVVTSSYVGSLCEALVELAATDAAGLVHVTSPDAMSKYAFGVAVAQEFGLDATLITPAAADVVPPRNRDLSLDVSRAQALLGRPLPTQHDGIERARTERARLAALVRS